MHIVYTKQADHQSAIFSIYPVLENFLRFQKLYSIDNPCIKYPKWKTWNNTEK